MRIKVLSLFLILSILSIFVFYSCSTLIPNHPTKSESEYYIDKTECEKSARSIAYSQQYDFRVSDERDYTRKCLKDKGWSYRKK